MTSSSVAASPSHGLWKNKPLVSAFGFRRVEAFRSKRGSATRTSRIGGVPILVVTEVHADEI